MSQSLTVPSSPTEASVLPSGEIATERTICACASAMRSGRLDAWFEGGFCPWPKQDSAKTERPRQAHAGTVRRILRMLLIANRRAQDSAGDPPGADATRLAPVIPSRGQRTAYGIRASDTRWLPHR